MSDDIVTRLREAIIADAVERREIVNGILAERLIRERHKAADEIENLTAERDALRAELAAERDLREREKDAAVAMLQVKIDALASERKLKTIYYDEWQDANNENEALRALLREARPYVSHHGSERTNDLLARIEAALNKGGE